MQVSEKGEGTGENQRTQKNKVGEGETNKPSHDVSSQQDIVINMDSNISLSMPSQKGMDIENSTQPGALNNGEGIKFKHITPYVRKKKKVRKPGNLGSTH